VLSAVGVSKAHVAGHSLGTIVAQHWRPLSLERVRSLACSAAACAARLRRPGIRARGAKARSEGVGACKGLQMPWYRVRPRRRRKRSDRPRLRSYAESLMRQDRDGYARTCDALADAQAADLAKLTCPVLLVTGDEDRSRRLSRCARWEARFPQRVRSCALWHWTPVEKPEECVVLLTQFYAQRM